MANEAPKAEIHRPPRRLHFLRQAQERHAVAARTGGIDNVHPLSGREIRALRQLRRENMESRYVFITERGGPATTAGFLKTVARTGEAAKPPFPTANSGRPELTPAPSGVLL
jgi:hypothetical protein